MRSDENHAAETSGDADLAPWIAETLDRVARDPANREDGAVRRALRAEIANAPRPISFEEMLRGSAIALELMAAEAVERIRVLTEAQDA